MTNAQQTQGQWRIGDAGLTVFGPPNGKPSPETIANCRTKGNARLIAATPELLRVAEMVLEYATVEMNQNLIAAAQKAIAKAQGCYLDSVTRTSGLICGD